MPRHRPECSFGRIVWTLFPEGGVYFEVNREHSSDGNYPWDERGAMGEGGSEPQLGAPAHPFQGANYSGTEAR